MKNYFITLLAVLINVLAWGQELPNVTPPTPEATQIAKFVDMPVALYNGTPNISVPIYTFSVSGIQVPISLSYHAKGIQVSEIASRTGLGWSLSAGGVITRQIRGKADNEAYGYLYGDYIDDFQTNSSLRIGLMTDDANNQYDSYPDVFMFNFMGYSGKFIFDQITKQPLLQKYDDLKITVNGTNPIALEGFTIITADGTTFVFDQTESSYSNNFRHTTNSTGSEELPNSPTNVNSWYLSSVTTASNETITFSYQTETVRSYDVSEISDSPSTDYLAYSERVSYQKQLQQISFKTGKVVFNASNLEREDLYGGKALDNIEVYAKIAPTLFALEKKFKLNYFYTTSNDDNLQTVYDLFKILPVAQTSKKRLFLESVDELEVSNPYNHLRTSFEYNTTVLPNRMSNAKDNWGYYNGKPNNYLKSFLNTDRKVDITFSEAGILKKITHPTGGTTEFVYEHNKVIPPTYFKNLLIPFSNPLVNKTVGLFKNINLYDSATNSYYKSFEIKNRPTSVNFNVNFDNTNCQMGGPAQATCRYKVFILDGNGSILYELTLGANNGISLFPGNYSIKVTPNYGAHNPGVFVEIEEFTVNGSWQEQDIPDDQELLAAGKRIRKIIKKDNGITQLEKEYFYTDEQGKCSGIPFSIPPYLDIITQVGNSVLVGRQVAGPGGPIADFAGNSLGYSRVTEVQNGDGPLGKTVSTFTVYADMGEYYKFPYHIPIDLEWGRGMPLETRYYKYENSTYSLVKKNINVYKFYESCTHPAGLMEQCLVDPNNPNTNLSADFFVNNSRFKVPSYKFGKYLTGITFDCVANSTDPDCYRTTYFVGGKMNLSYSDTYDYFDSGAVLYSRSNFYHQGVNHYQKTSETTTSSDGTVVESKYFYAPEMNHLALIAKNMIGIPLKTETYRNSERLSVTETVYKDWGNNLLAPEFVKVAKGNHTQQTRVRYNLVDNTNGNPLELQQENGTLVCYIWGYNKTQPVAKIENIAYNSIPSNLITAIQTATDTGTEANVLTALNSLRNNAALSGAMVTTYSYIPLVGVRTITDPKGDTLTYEYDPFNRLKAVYDKNGNKLSENQYHYRTQN